MAQPSGIGLAPIRETDTATAGQNTLTRVGNALQGAPTGGAPQFKDNPLGAIGLVLSNFSAGLRGQELPTERIARNQIAQQQLQFQRLRITLDAVKEGVNRFIGLDPDDPRTSEALQRFTAQFTPTLGEGFSESLTAGLQLARSQGREALDGLVEHQARIAGICGFDRDCIVETASNTALMNRFNATADQERVPGIMQKFQAINQAVGDNKALQALAEQGYTLAELQQLPEGFRFTDEEIRTITRDEQIQNLLISSGFEPPNLTAEMARATRIAELQIATTLATRQPPNLSFQTITENGVEFLVGLDPKTGNEVSRRRSGLSDEDVANLNFQRIRENGQEFIIGLNPETGFEESRVLAGTVTPPDEPNLSFQTIEEGGEKFIVGLNPETGDEVSRIRQSAVVPSDPPNLSFKEVIESGQRFIVGLNPQTGEEQSRFPAGKADEPFDSTRLRAGLSLVINGQDVEGRGLGNVVEGIVRDLDPAMAATMLGNLQSGGFEITTSPEGVTTIRTGSALGVSPADRVTQTREAQEQAAIPTAVANLAGLPADMTLAEAREQRIAIPDDVVIRQLQGQKTAAQSLMRRVDELAQTIVGRPEVLSAPGAIVSAVNSTVEAGKGLVRLLGAPITVNDETATVEDLLNPAVYEQRLTGLGYANAQVQSLVVSVAFAAAAAEGQVGRGISDKDVDRFILQIGKNADPDIFTRILANVGRESDVRFQDAVFNAVGKRPPSLREEAAQLEAGRLGEIMTKPLGELTSEEIDRLATSEQGRQRLRELLGESE